MSKNDENGSWPEWRKRAHRRNMQAKIMEVMESQNEPALPTLLIASESGLSSTTARKYCRELAVDGILESGELNSRHPDKLYWWIDL